MNTEKSKNENISSFLGNHEAVLAALNNKTKQNEPSSKPEKTKEPALKTPAVPTPKQPQPIKRPALKPTVLPPHPPKPPVTPPRPARVIPPKPPAAPKPSTPKTSPATPMPQMKRTPIIPPKKIKTAPTPSQPSKPTLPPIGGIIGAIALIVACIAVFIYQSSNKKNANKNNVKVAVTQTQTKPIPAQNPAINQGTTPPIVSKSGVVQKQNETTPTIAVTSTPVETKNLNDELLGHWNFNNLSGTTLPDSSSYKRDGILQNGFSSESLVSGISGTALEFNGKKDVIKIPALPYSPVITVSIWSKSSPPAKSNHLISNHPSWFLTGYDQKIIRFAVQTTRGETHVRFKKIENPEGEWHHYVGVYDGKSIKAYLDGTLSSTTPWDGDLIFGQGTAIGGYWKTISKTHQWKGALDEARIYNRALNAEEVLQLTQLEKPLMESN